MYSAELHYNVAYPSVGGVICGYWDGPNIANVYRCLRYVCGKFGVVFDIIKD
ncbi:MAG: hypothetical protein WC203_07055 [Candidatus Bathyarchaeia archaeon]